MAPTEIARSPIWALPQAADRLVLDTGGLLARHGIARFAAEQHPAALAALVAELGYHALAFSEADLSDPRDLVLARARALHTRGIPLIASNLYCQPEGQALCAALWDAREAPFRFVAQAGDAALSIAIFAYLEPEAREHVASDRMDGIRLANIIPSIRRDVRRARAHGDLAIAILDTGLGAAAMSRASAMIAALAPEDRPDLVFVSRAGSELIFARPSGFRPPLIAAPTRGGAEVRVRREDSQDGDQEERHLDILAQPMSAPNNTTSQALSEAAPAPAFTRFMDAIGEDYCHQMGQPLAGGRLHSAAETAEEEAAEEETAMNASALTTLLTEAMREAADADLSLLNASVIDARWRPARADALTESDVQVAVQFDEPILVADVTAAWLKRLATSDARARGLVIQGLSSDGTKIYGRPVQDGARYRVATIGFLASGGNGLVPEGLSWEPTEHSLREVLLTHLSQPRDSDVRRSFEDPFDRVEWTFLARAELTFSGSATRDPAGYAEGPLQNTNQFQLGAAAALSLSGVSRWLGWENLLSLDYASARAAASEEYQEGVDQLLFRSNLTYRGLRGRLDEFYVPDLVAEALIRTELTRGVDREAHFLSTRIAGGLLWRLHAKFRVKLLAGLEISDALIAETRTIGPGIGVQLEVLEWALLTSDERRLSAQMTLDYFASGLGTDHAIRQLLQGNLGLVFTLNRFLGLSLTTTFYGLRVGAQPFALATQTSIGLRAQWLGRTTP